jgi:hypothetical protein
MSGGDHMTTAADAPSIYDEINARDDGEQGRSDAAPPQDLEAIAPDPQHLTIEGIPARVRPLRTRELMMLLGIVTKGAGTEAIGALAGQADHDTDAFGALLAGALLSGMAGAADEVVALVRALAEPIHAGDKAKLDAAMDNPDPAVTLDVVAAVAYAERENLSALVGKARQLATMLAAVYAKTS